MRALVRKFLLSFLSKNAHPYRGVHILNGHFIQEIESALSPKVLEDFIRGLKDSFDIIDLREAINLIEKKSHLDHPKLALTFDDGFLECHKTMLPVFEKYNVKAAFFINPASVENQNASFANGFIKNRLQAALSKRFITWDMVREMNALGHTIGNHTVNHVNLKGLSDAALENEIVRAKETVEDKTGVECSYFAFPFGTANYFDQKAIDAVCSSHKYAFTSGLYNEYYYAGNKHLLSRRHFECNWPVNHIKYFTSKPREYLAGM